MLYVLGDDDDDEEGKRRSHVVSPFRRVAEGEDAMMSGDWGVSILSS